MDLINEVDEYLEKYCAKHGKDKYEALSDLLIIDYIRYRVETEATNNAWGEDKKNRVYEQIQSKKE